MLKDKRRKERDKQVVDEDVFDGEGKGDLRDDAPASDVKDRDLVGMKDGLSDVRCFAHNRHEITLLEELYVVDRDAKVFVLIAGRLVSLILTKGEGQKGQGERDNEREDAKPSEKRVVVGLSRARISKPVRVEKTRVLRCGFAVRLVMKLSGYPTFGSSFALRLKLLILSSVSPFF